MAKQKLVITGIPPYDGEYPIDDSGFTTQEYHYIKQVSGVRAGELEEAIAAGDAGVMVALTAITLQRNGKVVQLQLLWDAKESCFDVVDILGETDEGEDEERPPATATTGGNASEPDVAEKPNENSASSGPSGTPTGVDSQNDPSGTGSPGSEPSSESVPAT